MKAVSLPHEHGGILTLAGGVVGAALLAPRPVSAVAAGIVLAAGFLAREALIKRARWDAVLLAALAIVAAVGVWLAGPLWGALAALAAVAIVTVFLLARRARQHRAPWFELAGMTALGGAAALEALAGGAAPLRSAALGVLLGAHAAVSVPLVRTQLRRMERAKAPRAELWAVAGLAGAAVVLAALGRPLAAVAFVPRVIHLGWRRVAGVRPARPALVGLRETALLAVTVAVGLWSV